jgi:hypothetical protein
VRAGLGSPYQQGAEDCRDYRAHSDSDLFIPSFFGVLCETVIKTIGVQLKFWTALWIRFTWSSMDHPIYILPLVNRGFPCNFQISSEGASDISGWRYVAGA